jgi:hypothetical protein
MFMTERIEDDVQIPSFTFLNSSAPNPENSENAPLNPIVRFDNSANQNV